MNKFNARCQSGHQYEAVIAEQLKKLAADGLISQQDEICPVGTDRWIPCAKVKGLFEESTRQTRPTDSSSVSSGNSATEMPSELFNVRCQSGQRYESVTAEQLKKLAAGGLVSQHDEICQIGTDRWIPCTKVKGLFKKSTPQTRPTDTSRDAVGNFATESSLTETAEQIEQTVEPEEDSRTESKIAEKLGAAIGGMMLGIGIIYLSGWSLILGSLVIPNDLDLAGSRFVDHLSPDLSNREQTSEFGWAKEGIKYGYAIHFMNMIEDGYAVNRFMAVVAINAKPWGFVNTFRFFNSPTVQYAGLTIGIIIFFSGIGYATGSHNGTDD